MTKKQLVIEVSNDTCYSRRTVELIVESLTKNVMYELSHGRKVSIEGFGTFEPKKRSPRTGRNPHTGEAVPIPARIMPVFKPGKLFKRAIER